MPKPVRLELAWRHRPSRDGLRARDYLDFVVDGRSPEDLLRPGTNVGVLGWGDPEVERDSIDWLLGRKTPPLASGRVPLFVCAACGELDCGAVAVRVERTHAGVEWSGFAFESTQPGSTRSASATSPAPFSSTSASTTKRCASGWTNCPAGHRNRGFYRPQALREGVEFSSTGAPRPVILRKRHQSLELTQPLARDRRTFSPLARGRLPGRNPALTILLARSFGRRQIPSRQQVAARRLPQDDCSVGGSAAPFKAERGPAQRQTERRRE